MEKPIRPKVLFVDDEPSIYSTMPLILEMHGFEVVANSNVSDALTQISNGTFDILLTDLNIGFPGDGFTLVGAMKRKNPETCTVIITGYPDFQNALAAIRNLVDDYILKPANVTDLVGKLRRLLTDKTVPRQFVVLRVSQVLAQDKEKIMDYFCNLMCTHPRFSHVSLSREERLGDLSATFDSIIEAAKSPTPEKIDYASVIEIGKRRRLQGYTACMVIEESELFLSSVFLDLQERLLDLDLSLVIPDLIKLSKFIVHRLGIAIEAFDGRLG